MDLDVTSPLRNLTDLENSFQDILNSKAITLFSVNTASRNPYFNMVEQKPNGFFNLVKVSILFFYNRLHICKRI